MGEFSRERRVLLMPPIVDLGFLYPNSLKSSTGNILWRNSKFSVVEVVAITRSYIADDLKLWVGSKSHKHKCLCSSNLDRRVHEFKAACGHVSKYYKRYFRFRKKSIVKFSFYHNEFVALRII